MKIVRIMALLGFVVLTSVACSKNSTPVDSVAPVVNNASNIAAVDVAAQTITDGVIYFEFNKYDISSEYRETLTQKASIMRQFPSVRVRIEGHCDARGTQEYNLALGERRARAAYEYMVLLGVNPNQLELISYGKERPAVMGTGDDVWALNRRNNFRVIAR